MATAALTFYSRSPCNAAYLPDSAGFTSRNGALSATLRQHKEPPDSTACGSHFDVCSAFSRLPRPLRRRPAPSTGAPARCPPAHTWSTFGHGQAAYSVTPMSSTGAWTRVAGSCASLCRPLSGRSLLSDGAARAPGGARQGHRALNRPQTHAQDDLSAQAQPRGLRPPGARRAQPEKDAAGVGSAAQQLQQLRRRHRHCHRPAHAADHRVPGRLRARSLRDEPLATRDAPPRTLKPTETPNVSDEFTSATPSTHYNSDTRRVMVWR